jgi:type II secretory pathway component PulL
LVITTIDEVISKEADMTCLVVGIFRKKADAYVPALAAGAAVAA